MLLKRAVLEGIAAGRIDLVFRRWQRPTVRTGGSLRTAVGLLAIESVDAIDAAGITDRDAREAGFGDRSALLDDLGAAAPGTMLYRIGIRLAGPDPRAGLAAQAALSGSEVEELRRRLARLDARGPEWTGPVLERIAAAPGTPAVEIAAGLGFEKAWLKTRIRRLKELGLTESLSVGYRLSPRGRALLDASAAEPVTAPPAAGTARSGPRR